jgi:hypothetical protein
MVNHSSFNDKYLLFGLAYGEDGTLRTLLRVLGSMNLHLEEYFDHRLPYRN